MMKAEMVDTVLVGPVITWTLRLEQLDKLRTAIITVRVIGFQRRLCSDHTTTLS